MLPSLNLVIKSTFFTKLLEPLPIPQIALFHFFDQDGFQYSEVSVHYVLDFEDAIIEELLVEYYVIL